MRPDHLLEQAEALLGRARQGPGRQADKKRAVSTAYYALFHLTLQAMADLLIGRGARETDRYVVAYRSVDHRRLRAVAEQCAAGRGDFAARDPHLRTFCVTLQELGELRNRADYDPSFRLDLAGARQALLDAQAAVEAFAAASEFERELFLTLIAFPRRWT